MIYRADIHNDIHNHYDLALSDVNTLLNDHEFISNNHHRVTYLKALVTRAEIYDKQGKDGNDILPDLNQALSGDGEELLYRNAKADWEVALCNRILIHMKHDNLDEALIDLNTAIKKKYINQELSDGQTIDLRFKRSLIYRSKGDSALELKDLDDVLDDTPDHIEALKRRQVIHTQASNIRQATLDEHALVEATLAQNGTWRSWIMLRTKARKPNS